jgi:hypothetical protein
VAVVFSGSLQGAKEAIDKLAAIDRSFQKRILRKGMRKAGQVGARMSKPFIPKDMGILKKSWYSRLARQKKNAFSAAVIVGPRRRFANPHGAVPTKYAHLADRGARPHRIAAEPGKRLAFRSKTGGSVVVSSVSHPGARAQNFTRRAASSSSGAMLGAFTTVVSTELGIQAAKPKPSEVDDGT